MFDFPPSGLNSTSLSETARFLHRRSIYTIVMGVDLSEFIMTPHSTKVVYSSTSMLQGVFICYSLGNSMLILGEDKLLHEL